MCLDRCDVCVCRLWDWTLSERSQEQEVTVDDVFVTGVMFVFADSGSASGGQREDYGLENGNVAREQREREDVSAGHTFFFLKPPFFFFSVSLSLFLLMMVIIIMIMIMKYLLCADLQFYQSSARCTERKKRKRKARTVQQQ